MSHRWEEKKQCAYVYAYNLFLKARGHLETINNRFDVPVIVWFLHTTIIYIMALKADMVKVVSFLVVNQLLNMAIFVNLELQKSKTESYSVCFKMRRIRNMLSLDFQYT
jgi:hypothetical protein